MAIIEDFVYGKVEINEAVLLELIESVPLQRLKGVDQQGAYHFVNNGFKRVNRFEHCVGVMILLKKLGASVEEQIAGLMHDVPHTAFSHVVDWVFKTEDNAQDFHEQFFEKVVLNSEIPSILEKYGFDVNRVINESLFTLLEKGSPDLCADRLDYTFRDCLAFMGEKYREKINLFLKHLVVNNNEIIFDDLNVALEFTNLYLDLDEKVWRNIRSVASFHILAEALKEGLDCRAISFDDLFLTDDMVLEKLQSSKNEKIIENLNLLRPSLQVEKVESDVANINTVVKLRYVNPKVLQADFSLIRVSERFQKIMDLIEDRKEKTKNGVNLKISLK